MTFTPHPHARYIRRARKYPLHVRYNPRTDIPVYVPTYPPPPPAYPSWDPEVVAPPPSPVPEELAGLPSGFVYFISPNGAFYTDASGTLLIGAL